MRRNFIPEPQYCSSLARSGVAPPDILSMISPNGVTETDFAILSTICSYLG